MAPSLSLPTLLAIFVLALVLAHRFGAPRGRGPI
jgi:hypothetical protein